MPCIVNITQKSYLTLCIFTVYNNLYEVILMKKILASLTAVLMLGLVSCQSDKPQNPNETAISEPIEEIPTEPVFTEYNRSDFKEINVALNKINNEPPMEITEIDLSNVLDEKIIPLCKLPENRESLKEALSSYDDTENLDEFCDTEIKGSVKDFALDGDMIYMLVDYDLLCNRSHCLKIVTYDIKKETLDELYSFSSADETEYISGIFSFDGELYVIRSVEDDENEYVSGMCKFENGSFEAVLTDDEFPRDLEGFNFCKESPNRFILQSYTFVEGKIVIDLYEYAPESNNLSEIYCYEGDSEEIYRKKPVFFDNEIISAELDDNRNISIVGENFRLNTGVRGGIPLAAGGNRISVLMEDKVQSLLYTYDLNKMECYISDVSDKLNGNLIFSAGKDLIIGHYARNLENYTGLDMNYSLMMPDIGAFFNITDIYANAYYFSNFSSWQGVHRGYNNGRFWIAESSNAKAIQFSNEERCILNYEEAILGKFIIVGE